MRFPATGTPPAPSTGAPGFWRSRYAIGLVVMGAVAGYFLLTEHLAHTLALATAGPYARIRHPQYVAFVMILLGFLLQWPTLLTLLMFPVLLVMYGRLALTEETDMRTLFGQAYERYASVTPRFFPKLSRRMAAPD